MIISRRSSMSDEYAVRLVLEERKDRGYKVAWEDSWVDKVNGSDVKLKDLTILGITKDSDQRKIKQAKFVIENRAAKQNENQQEVWTYDKLRAKAPELLISFYEEQLEK